MYTCVLIRSFSHSLPTPHRHYSWYKAAHWSMGHTLGEDWLSIPQQPTAADSSLARAEATWAPPPQSHWNFDQRDLLWLWILHGQRWLLWVLCAAILSCNPPQDRWLLSPVGPFFLWEGVCLFLYYHLVWMVTTTPVTIHMYSTADPPGTASVLAANCTDLVFPQSLFLLSQFLAKNCSNSVLVASRSPLKNVLLQHSFVLKSQVSSFH